MNALVVYDSQFGNTEKVAQVVAGVVYDPETFLALSEPLINIRCTLRAAEQAGVLRPEVADLLEEIAVSLYFPDRTWDTICSDAGIRIPQDEIRAFREFLVTSAVDQKRSDALRALMRTKELAEELGITMQGGWCFSSLSI